MKIERVRIKNIDDSIPFLNPTRTIEIRTNRGVVRSPNRCVTSYEFNKKAEAPSITTFDNSVSMYTRTLPEKYLQSLLTDDPAVNTIVKKQIQGLEKTTRISEYSILHMTTYKISSLSNKNLKNLLLNEDNRNRLISYLLLIQTTANQDIISIPNFELPVSVLKTLYSNIVRTVEKLNKQVLFSIDLAYDGFIEILDYITKDLQSNSINLVFKRINNVSRHYEYLKKYARKDIVFFMSDVDRIDSNNQLSTMHYMPFFGNDFYSIKTPPQFFAEKPKNIDTTNLKVLDRNDLTISKFDNKKVTIDNIVDVLSTVDDYELRYKFENIKEAETDTDKYNNINAITKIHELKASTSEFAKMTEYIDQHSSKDYVKSKKELGSKISSIAH